MMSALFEPVAIFLYVYSRTKTEKVSCDKLFKMLGNNSVSANACGGSSESAWLHRGFYIYAEIP